MESPDQTTRQLMFSLIEFWKGSGKSQKAFCLEKSIAYPKFHYWLKKYNDEKNEGEDLGPSFSQVTIKKQNEVRPNHIELQYPDGRKLVFPQGVDASFLRALLN